MNHLWYRPYNSPAVFCKVCTLERGPDTLNGPCVPIVVTEKLEFEFEPVTHAPHLTEIRPRGIRWVDYPSPATLERYGVKP